MKHTSQIPPLKIRATQPHLKFSARFLEIKGMSSNLMLQGNHNSSIPACKQKFLLKITMGLLAKSGCVPKGVTFHKKYWIIENDPQNHETKSLATFQLTRPLLEQYTIQYSFIFSENIFLTNTKLPRKIFIQA
jgi:hypothetical protein